MAKKYIEIKFGEKVVGVCAIKECEPLAFIELEKVAKENAKQINENFLNTIKILSDRIESLENEVRILKGED